MDNITVSLLSTSQDSLMTVTSGNQQLLVAGTYLDKPDTDTSRNSVELDSDGAVLVRGENNFLDSFSDLIAASEIRPVDTNDKDIQGLIVGISDTTAVFQSDKDKHLPAVSESSKGKALDKTEDSSMDVIPLSEIKVEADVFMEPHGSHLELVTVKTEFEDLTVEPCTAENDNVKDNSSNSNSLNHEMKSPQGPVETNNVNVASKSVMIIEADTHEALIRSMDVDSTSLSDKNSRDLGMTEKNSAFIPDGSAVLRKPGRPKKVANYKSETNPLQKSIVVPSKTNPLQTSTVWVRKSGRQVKPKKRFSFERDDSSPGSDTEQKQINKEVPKKKRDSSFDRNSGSSSSSENDDGHDDYTPVSKRKVNLKKISETKQDRPAEQELVRQKKQSQLEEDRKYIISQLEGKMTCPVCNMAFTSLGQLNRHQSFCAKQKNGHEVSKPSEDIPKNGCPVCHKSFSNRYGIKKHMNREHECLMSVTCLICHKNIGLLTDCHAHMMSFHSTTSTDAQQKSGRKKNKCPLCDEHYIRCREVSIHLLRAHSSSLHVSCTLCHLAVGTELEYLDHFEDFHTGDNAKEICSTLPVSKKKHCVADSKNYICTLCQKEFERYKELVLHTLTHKVNKSLETVSRDWKKMGDSETLLQEEECPSADKSSDQEALEKFPLTLSTQTSDMVIIEHTVSSLGSEAIESFNSSFKVMFEISAKLCSELSGKDSWSLQKKADLNKKLNLVLSLTGHLTDLGKCLLLVSEQSGQTKRIDPIDSDREDDYLMGQKCSIAVDDEEGRESADLPVTSKNEDTDTPMASEDQQTENGVVSNGKEETETRSSDGIVERASRKTRGQKTKISNLDWEGQEAENEAKLNIGKEAGVSPSENINENIIYIISQKTEN